jgi:septal ring factor EnvC (AmiA/AmiB activator)
LLGTLVPEAVADSVVIQLEETERSLGETKRALDQSRRVRSKLDSKVATIRQQVLGIRSELVAAAAEAQDIEARLSELEAVREVLHKDRRDLRIALRTRRAHLSQTLAAIQRLGRSPPEALLLMPTSITQTSRTSLLLGAVARGLESEASGLRDELIELAQLEDAIEVNRSEVNLTARSLADQRVRLRDLLQQKVALQSEAEAEQQAARALVARLARDAKDLQDLVHKLEAERQALEAVEPEPASSVAAAPIESPIAAAPEAPKDAPEESGLPAENESDTKLARAPAEPSARDAAAARSEMSTLARQSPPTEPRESVAATPKRSVSAARSSFTYPARGTVVSRFGQTLASGISAKGIAIETRAAAQIVAPYDGQVVFAGPFRNYGQLLIIAHGEGYHSLLAGLGRIDARLGQRVLAGEPVGVMQSSSDERPRLYVELRRKGRPIDPLPWLAAGDSKVSG